jgi:signal transduction histidine kinase/HAMP domain-containing protein
MRLPGGVRQHRLVNRLVVTTVIAGLGAGLIGAVLLDRAESATSLADARARLRIAAEQYVVRFDNRIDNLVDELRLVATRQPIAAVDADAASELRVILRVAPRFDELVLYDSTGSPVAAAATRFLAEAASYPPLPTSRFLTDAAGSVDLSFGSGRTIEVVIPVESPPGQTIGALLARASSDAVAPIEETLASGGPVPFLLGADGTVLAHPDRSQALDGVAVPIDAILASPDHTEIIERNGTRQLVAAAESERLPVFIAVEQPETVARESSSSDVGTLIVILLVVMLAVVVAVIATGEMLLRPLRPLTAAVARVGRGERGVRTHVKGHAELGLLAGEVDRMAEALDQRADQVEELQSLALLVGSLSERAEVARRVVTGAAKLVRCDGVALVTPVHGTGGTVEASTGTLAQPVLIEEVAAGAVRTQDAFRRSIAEPQQVQMLAVPLVGLDSEPIGTLVVNRVDEPFDDAEAGLLAAFAAYAAVAVDNARRLQAQHALADELQQAVDRRRDLIGTITHEFRTPLTCIEGFSTALLEGWGRFDDEERRELVTRIAHHSDELADLVSRFLDFAVTERDGMSAQNNPIELGAAVDHTVAGLAPLLQDRRVLVDVPQLVVVADSTLLRRTLTNLLSNAVKFSPSGSPITIRAADVGGRARIEVVDEGIGMTAHEAARAFEPFWRGGVASTRSTRGAGLGLALVNEYVRVMGGVCGVTSHKDQGSNFYVVLPLAPPENFAHGPATEPA